MNSDRPVVAEAFGELGTDADTYGPTLNTQASPAAVEIIGRALAEVCRDHRPQRVAVWNTSDDAVLAHIVARELGVPVIRAAEVEGIVFFQPAASPGTRIAVIATAWEPRRLQTILSLSASTDSEVVVAAAVVATATLQEAHAVPTVSLVSGADVGGLR